MTIRTMRPLIRLVIAVGLLTLLIQPASQSFVQARTLHPAMRFVTNTTYPLVVKSTGWKSGSRVIFTVRQMSIAAGGQVQTNSAGTFVVAVIGADRCSNPVFTARDFRSHQVVLHGPALACPASANQVSPQLKVLRGKIVKSRVVVVRGTQPASVTLRVGDELDIYEQEQKLPAFTPRVDSTYLALIAIGTTPARMCPQVDCGSEAYWKYVAVRTGQTYVDLSPACRQVTPPCMIHDWAINVHILPAASRVK
jgi:hypothetical protein